MNFNTILIPVDFTVNTTVAIKKGVDLCEGPDPAIHLIHVPKLYTGSLGYYRYLLSYPLDASKQDNSWLQGRLEECLRYIGKLRNDIKTCYWISYSTATEKAIAEKAKDLAADLIIIGKNSQHSLFPFLNTIVPSRLAKRTGISVLTVKPGALSGTFRTVVMPIGSRFSQGKVEVINELVNKFYLHIRLLLLVERGDDPEKVQASLLNTCRRVKSPSLTSISYEVLHAENKNMGILNYCRTVDADLLVVHPESETKIGWFNKHISDELPVSSKTQVLAVGQGNLSLV